MLQKKFRRICFTLNNYTKEDEDKLTSEFNSGKITYLMYGKEIAPTTGTPHLQGYIEFKNQQGYRYISKILRNNHFDAAKGNAAQNLAYCSKDGIVTKLGNPKEQGKRNDLTRIKEMINNSTPMKTIINECENYQQMRCAEKLMSYKKLDVKTRNIPEVIYIHGESGNGKTEYAHNICNEDSTWTMNDDNLDWFDGYDYDEDVILNDFRESCCKLNKLLNLMDGYEMRVKIKGSFTIWKPKRIIITSVIHPKNLYSFYGEESQRQLLRRITKFVEIDSKHNVKISSKVEGNTGLDFKNQRSTPVNLLTYC